MTYKDIQRETAAEWGMTRETMLFRGQSAGKVAARCEAMSRCQTTLGMGYAEIGRAFNCHHTTVMHHLKRVESKEKTALMEARAIIAQLSRKVGQMARQIEEQAQMIERLTASKHAVQLEARKPAESARTAA